MTDFYWIGGTGPWDNASTANWSLSSGGAAGAGPPTVADNAIFDSNSGAGTVSVAATGTALAVTINLSTLTVQLAGNVTFAGLVTLTAGTLDINGFALTAFNFASSNSNVRVLAFGVGHMDLTGNSVNLWDTATVTNLSVTGTPVVNCTYAGSTPTRVIITGSLSEANSISFNVTAGTDDVQLSNRYKNIDFTGFAGNLNLSARSVYGNLTLSAGMTLTAGTAVTTLAATSGTQVITSNGNTMDFPITFNGSGGSARLADTLTLGATRAFTFAAGPILLDLNAQTLSAGSFVSGNSTTRTIAGGSGSTIVVTGSGATAFSAAAAANLTFTGTVAISMTSASAKTFAGNTGVSWPTLNQGGAGALTITGANTFADITNSVNGSTVTLPASTITTVGALSLHGAAGSLTTLQSSSAGTPATLSKATGGILVTYLSIKDIAATGGASWRAPLNIGNVNVSGNTGWNFATPLGGAGRATGMGLGITI